MTQPSARTVSHTGNKGEPGPRASSHKPSQLFHSQPPEVRSPFRNMFFTCTAPGIHSGLPSLLLVCIFSFVSDAWSSPGWGVGCKVRIFKNSFSDLLCLIWAANGSWCQRLTTVWSAQPSLLNLDDSKSLVSPNKVWIHLHIYSHMRLYVSACLTTPQTWPWMGASWEENGQVIWPFTVNFTKEKKKAMEA